MTSLEIAHTTLRVGPLTFDALAAGRRGPVVLCVHGFPDTHHTFRHLLPALAASGYRAVAPLIRGYGPTSRPADGAYDVAGLAGDVTGWLDALGVERGHVVGHDWGAVMGYAAAAAAPARVASLVALAIPPLTGLPEVMLTRPLALSRLDYMALFQLRGVAERLVAARDGALLEALWRRWSPGYALTDADREPLRAVFERPDAVRAALGYYRALFALWRSPSRRSLALLRRPLAVPTQVLYGTRDGCMAAGVFVAAAARARAEHVLALHPVQGAGHFLHLERPDEVNARVVAWLRAREAAEGGSYSA